MLTLDIRHIDQKNDELVPLITVIVLSTAYQQEERAAVQVPS